MDYKCFTDEEYIDKYVCLSFIFPINDYQHLLTPNDQYYKLHSWQMQGEVLSPTDVNRYFCCVEIQGPSQLKFVNLIYLLSELQKSFYLFEYNLSLFIYCQADLSNLLCIGPVICSTFSALIMT